MIESHQEVREVDIKEKLEEQLFKARERAQTANDTVRRLEEIVQHIGFLENVDLSDLRQMPIAKALAVIATNKQSPFCNGFLSTSMAVHILLGLGFFKTRRNAETSISSVLSRSKQWRHVGHGIWKYEPQATNQEPDAND